MHDDHIFATPKADVDILSNYFSITDWNKFYWGFICYSRQDYAEVIPMVDEDEIFLGVYCGRDGCLCELSIRWHKLDNKGMTPRLEVFSDAWALLQTPTISTVMEQLAQMRVKMNHVPTPDDMSKILIESGFTDLSDYPLGM